MNIVFVSATALTSGGGLSTLKQFLENIPDNSDFMYYVFCSLESLESDFSKKNVHFIYPKYRTGIKRIYWDYIGLKQWSVENAVKPGLIISLQNTTVRFDNAKIPQISYLMQAIPFVNKSWNPFKKEERALWFYKNIYPFFISQFLNKKHYVVTQSKWIKYAFSEKFNFPEERIFAIRPIINIDNSSKKLDFNDDNYHIFCPSSAFIYKNNMEIVNALIYLKQVNEDITNIKVHITINEDDDASLKKMIDDNNLNANFNFLGRVSYDTMLKYYASSDAVVFPSYLETFGLPLLEAASFGKPVIAADEGYAQEVIGEYGGASLLSINSPELWGNTILKIKKENQVFEKYKANFKESWEDFFILIENILKKEI